MYYAIIFTENVLLVIIPDRKDQMHLPCGHCKIDRRCNACSKGLISIGTTNPMMDYT